MCYSLAPDLHLCAASGYAVSAVKSPLAFLLVGPVCVGMTTLSLPNSRSIRRAGACDIANIDSFRVYAGAPSHARATAFAVRSDFGVLPELDPGTGMTAYLVGYALLL